MAARSLADCRRELDALRQLVRRVRSFQLVCCKGGTASDLSGGRVRHRGILAESGGRMSILLAMPLSCLIGRHGNLQSAINAKWPLHGRVGLILRAALLHATRCTF